MKKFLIGLMIGAMALMGCAGLTVQKQTTMIPYYETVHWGEDQTCELDENVTFVGNCSKTYQVYPEDDMYWVKEENSNEDSISVTLVWDMPDSPALGVCFYNADTTEENCGVFIFDSLTSKHLFINEFETDGIIQGIPTPNLHPQVAKQIEDTKDFTVGEPCDICDMVKKQYESTK